VQTGLADIDHSGAAERYLRLGPRLGAALTDPLATDLVIACEALPHQRCARKVSPIARNVCSSEIASTGVNNDVREALHRSQLIDLTTTGRRSGLPRRIEIFLHDEDGVLFITGMPRRDRTRDWIHNITADPNVIVHLKKGIEADVPATARIIPDPHEARPLIEAAARRWRRDDVDDMIAHSPLIVLTAATAPDA
jgi:deazaflavin-dependent oxidoreductase (nitroreductase family)